jgi:hypothetical protein
MYVGCSVAQRLVLDANVRLPQVQISAPFPKEYPQTEYEEKLANNKRPFCEGMTKM